MTGLTLVPSLRIARAYAVSRLLYPLTHAPLINMSPKPAHDWFTVLFLYLSLAHWVATGVKEQESSYLPDPLDEIFFPFFIAVAAVEELVP